MSGAGILAWLLGLSLVSDFVKRHAVEVLPHMPLPQRRIVWGRYSRWDEDEWRNFVLIRLPGVYWEVIHDFAKRERRLGWVHHYAARGFYDIRTQAFGWQILQVECP